MNTNTNGGVGRKRNARRIAVIGLAVAVAAPVTLTLISKRLVAAEPVLAVQQPTLSPADALREGVRQYRNGQYEESVATLQSVNADSLSEADRKALYDTLGRADSAAASRKSARAEFELGQEALRGNRPGEAIHHYYNVVNNKFVDEGTKRKAQEQMAVADAQRKGAAGDNRQVYTSAVADYKAGNFGSAKQKFEGLQASGYKPAMFQRTPEDYLKDIARRMPPPETGPNRSELAMPGDQSLQPPVAPPVAQPPAPAPTAVAPPPAPAPEVATVPPPPAPEVATVPPPPPEIVPVPVPVPAPEVATVPPPPAPAPEVAPQPLPPPAPEVASVPPPIVPAPEPAPAPVAPAPVPEPVAVAPAPAPVAPAPAPLAPAPAPTAAPAPAPAPIVQAPPSADPRQLYLTGKKQFKDGDYANARKNLMAASDAGYKPRFLEDSPQTLLARMDKKEANDAAKAAKQEAKTGQPTAVAAAPVPVVAPAPAAAPAILPVPAPIDITPPPAPAPAPTAVAVAPPPAPIEPAPAPVAPAPAPVAPAPAPVEVAPVPAPVEVAPAPAPVPVVPPPAPAPIEPAPAPVEVAPAPAPAPVAPAPAPAPIEVAPPPPLVTPPPTVVVQAQPMQGVNANDPVARARQLVEEARAAEGRNDYATALNLYSDAASLDPNNAAAAAGRQQMLALQGKGATGASPLDQVEKNINARRQMIRYNFDTALDRAREATRQGDVGAAEVALENARVARASDPNIFTEQEVRDMETRIANAQLDLTKMQEGLATDVQTQTQKEAAARMKAQREQAEKDKQSTVADLRDQAQRLINETRYQEALGVIDQILAIDPTSDYGRGLRPLVEDKALILQQRRFREDFDRQFTKQLNQAEEKKIPYDDILRYPANWPDISELRDQTTASERRVGSADQAAQAQLDKKLPDLNFPAIGFADVIDFLRDVTGANIYVRWSALEAAGIDRNAPVNARLRDVKFSKALETILGDVGGGTVPLGYTVDEGIITVSTQEDLTRTVTPDTRVFDIRDLIIEVPDFTNAPTFNLQSQSNTASGGGGGGGSQSLFGGGSGGGGAGETQLRTRQQLIDEIKRLIQDTVAPDSWREAGGTVGAIQELSGQLIVTQTPENMRKLQDLLEQLRETRAIQVTVEARFLTVQRNYLEDIGFDLDVTLNNRDRDQNSSWSAIPITQSSSIYTANPTTGLPGSIRNVNNADVSGGPGGLGLSSLGLQGTYLDNFTVQFLIRATQAAQSSTLVTAPRLTLFNGQRAYVLVSRQTAYVSDLEPVVAQGAVAFNPTIGLVQSGVLLDVQATVSSDRKYVTLTLRPQLATLLDLLPFTFQSAQGNTATTAPVGGVTIGTNNPSGIIQQPILQITEVRTTVSVPDGGTLLLGGQTLAGEIEREAGVPILSKVPFLKRLFTNRSTAKDEQVLLILVKPTIVIQREQEQKQFPLLSSRVQ